MSLSSKKWADMSGAERTALVLTVGTLGVLGGLVLWIVIGVLVMLGQFVWEGVL